MSIIPIITSKQLLTILLKVGFKILRQRGSHIRLQHPMTKMSTTIPMHAGDLSRKMITKILKQAGLSVNEFIKFFRK